MSHNGIMLENQGKFHGIWNAREISHFSRLDNICYFLDILSFVDAIFTFLLWLYCFVLVSVRFYYFQKAADNKKHFQSQENI